MLVTVLCSISLLLFFIVLYREYRGAGDYWFAIIVAFGWPLLPIVIAQLLYQEKKKEQAARTKVLYTGDACLKRKPKVNKLDKLTYTKYRDKERCW